MWTIWFYRVGKCYSRKPPSKSVLTQNYAAGCTSACRSLGRTVKTIWRNTVSAEPLLGKSDADYIAHTEFVASPSDTHVAFDGLKLDIRTQNLPVYALWSDRNGQYTCAEPTAEGNAFLSPARGGQFVSGHGKKHYGMKIRLIA